MSETKAILNKIAVFYGKLGSGKTMSATIRAYREWLSGKRVYANFRLLFVEFIEKQIGRKLTDEDLDLLGLKKPELIDPISLLHNTKGEGVLRNGILVLDEAYSTVSSNRTGSVLSEIVCNFVTQTRKMELDIFFCSPIPDRIDKNIQTIANYGIRCNIDETRGVITNRILDLKSKVVKPYIYVIHCSDYYGIYDTKEIISPPNREYIKSYKKNLEKNRGKDLLMAGELS